MTGTVENIYIAAKSGEIMLAMTEAEFIVGKGIVGDRYASGTGQFSPPVQDADHEVTLIESEQVDYFNAQTASTRAAGEFRRNVVTRGIRLNELVGQEFQLGDVTLRGIRLCEPCKYLAAVVDARVLPVLVHRGGLRAGIVRGGTVRPGDIVTPAAQIAGKHR